MKPFLGRKTPQYLLFQGVLVLKLFSRWTPPALQLTGIIHYWSSLRLKSLKEMKAALGKSNRMSEKNCFSLLMLLIQLAFYSNLKLCFSKNSHFTSRSTRTRPEWIWTSLNPSFFSLERVFFSKNVSFLTHLEWLTWKLVSHPSALGLFANE